MNGVFSDGAGEPVARPYRRPDRAGAHAFPAVLSDVLERTLSGLTEDVRLADDLHMDSTLLLELLMAIEESFDIEVDPDKLDIKDFATVGTVAAFVERDTGQRAAG
jgi:acyl carrier protein